MRLGIQILLSISPAILFAAPLLGADEITGHSQVSQAASGQQQATNAPLEPRLSEHGFIKDIVERLHALDADIGKLLYNSTSMYSPDDQSSAFRDNSPQGGERFTEVLSDLDALQDEVSDVRWRES